jgi:hypothetical protein
VKILVIEGKRGFVCWKGYASRTQAVELSAIEIRVPHIARSFFFPTSHAIFEAAENTAVGAAEISVEDLRDWRQGWIR